MTSDADYSRDELTRLLSSSLGWDVANRALAQACAVLRLDTPRLSRQQAQAVFTRLSSEVGLIGISARVASSRLLAPRQPLSSTGPPGETRSLPALAKLLSATLGQERARQLIQETAFSCGFGEPEALSNAQAHRVLDSLSSEPGIIGVTARFAKTKLSLDS